MKYLVTPIVVSLMLCSVQSEELQAAQEFKGLTQLEGEAPEAASDPVEDPTTTAADDEPKPHKHPF
jgi:hypothetical protein